jgi:putative ABC transport system permease protein
MNGATLVRKNLGRNLLRTILLVASIFIAFLIFGVLAGFNDSTDRAFQSTTANRLVVKNKVSLVQPLPLAYIERIRALEGVTDATGQQWLGGYYQDPRNQVMTFAVDAEPFVRIYDKDYDLPEDQWRAFVSDRSSIIVGDTIARQYNFRVGQRIPLNSSIYTNRATGAQVWDFTIAGIYKPKRRGVFTGFAYFHHDYFRESATFGNNAVGLVIAATASPDLNEPVARRIDAMFANSAFQTATMDQQAYNRSFLEQLGDIKLIITLVVSAAFAAILLIVGNTMAMTVRERTREIGVLKTLGFGAPRIVWMVLSEALLLSVIGALLGLGAAAGLLAAISTQPDAVGVLNVSPLVAAQGLAIAILFGLVTGLSPALSAFNLRIVDALGRK